MALPEMHFVSLSFSVCGLLLRLLTDTFPSCLRGLLDISLWASIASHLSYWADEDVSHFMISQLLSRQRVIRR